MLIKDHVTAYVGRRSPAGLFIPEEVVRDCLIAAVRFYAGWAFLTDQSVLDLDMVTEDTDVTPGEWAVISPLFHLYAEREEARTIEASRQSGVMEMVGRSSGEVSADIAQAEMTLPQLSYVEPSFSIGLEG